MLLFVGLGNKGKEYENTRHNVGFLFLERLKRFFKIEGGEVLKFSASIFFFEFEGVKILCAKPQTFMNLSGNSVTQIMQFYKIKPENVFVFHDDIDLENAKIKFKTGGGDGGHNGLKSITASVGANYNRIRIGVGRPKFEEVSSFVLSNFKPQELQEIEPKMEVILQNLNLLILKKFADVSSKMQ